MERELALEFVRVTESAALAAAPFMGRGDKNGVDKAAVEAMRKAFDNVDIDGTVVIGEGEIDEAPMLYIGEKVGSGSSLKVDIAVDPIEGTTIVSKGLPNGIAVLAAASGGSFLHAPDMYMDKLVVGPGAKGVIDITKPIEENIIKVAESLGKRVQDMTVAILDKPRHKERIENIRKLGCRINIFPDGDVAMAIATATEEPTVDLLTGIGGAPEGVIAAAALKCLGGDMQAILKPRNEEEIQRAKEMGILDIERTYNIDELAKGEDIFFAATGITGGELLKGVRVKNNIAKTFSLIMRAKTGTVRYVNAIHNLDKKPL
ncbi:class II fructose-bisphosphatase [Alkalicella caledoniensis]|uniref:Fructose-1,6-bisphosphatase n=1 Tax=Alkalicella caledoniensis TaxID=2731377 RepID=A0A7G9W8W9_ALKCA|nr:class II fructose-bisphosphatase [Alkalicella caledoniensis]QNO15131.1 class II fructose-bisphosphatase [Alkalicella caledoniensis]